MSCTIAGRDAAEAGQCLQYVQQQLGLATCGASALDAWNGCYGGAHTGSPQSGDLVFFGAAASNGGFGHVGWLTGLDQFKSVLSDGNVNVCDVTGFAQDNGAAVLGYVSLAKIGGHAPAGLSLPHVSLRSALLWGGGILAALVGISVLEDLDS